MTDATVYLVTWGDDGGPSGLYGVYVDQARAERIAESIEGVVAAVPIIADFRPERPS